MRHRLRWGLATLLALLPLAVGGLLAQDQLRVRAQVDRYEMGEGEDVRLTIEIVGPSLERVGPPDMTVLEDFQVSGGPSVSSRYQWVNGVGSSSKTYTYILTPIKTGKATIPSLGVLAGKGLPDPGDRRSTSCRAARFNRRWGRLRRSRARLHPAARPLPEARRARGRAFRRRPCACAPRWTSARRMSVSRSRFVWSLAHSDRGVERRLPGEPRPSPGFWTEEIELPDQLEVRRVQIEGEMWSEITLMKRALFPTTSGQLTIPPLAWQSRSGVGAPIRSSRSSSPPPNR